MAVRPRPEWTAVEIASHAMEATSLSQLTLPEVKKLAARVLRDQGASTEQSATDPSPSRADVLVDQAIRRE